MKIGYVWEHNGDDSIIYFDGFPGAFARGATKDEALSKAETEIKSYLKWTNTDSEASEILFQMIQEHPTSLSVSDADSEVIYESEKQPLTMEKYIQLRNLALKSAQNFQELYNAMPDKNKSCLQPRKTFYGDKPLTANEMYEHTKSVNSYYFAEIGIEADNEPDIYSCRKRGFDLLEKTADFLENRVYEGSYGEQWSLRKLLRRFIWHDRIHAKAMWRMGIKTFGEIENVFMFEK